MKQISFRLKSGQLLKEEIEARIKQSGLNAGVLLSIVGGLEQVVLRMAGSKPENAIIKEWNEPFEIIAGTGTISQDGSHIHLALSDKEGHVIGGHLSDGCVIRFTAEIVLGVFDDAVFTRVFDQETGYKELVIN